jgi:hypothetical protein
MTVRKRDQDVVKEGIWSYRGIEYVVSRESCRAHQQPKYCTGTSCSKHCRHSKEFSCGTTAEEWVLFSSRGL